MIVEIEHPDAGPLLMPASPVKLSASPARVEEPAPRLGEHTADVLRGLLGLSDAEIRQLRQDQVI
jgi:crotonobetainyl-CoA:carnitine CoA-transferase CaiB-like acyl-CoA transferase